MVRKRGVARKSFARRRVRRVKKYDHNVIPKRFKVYLPRMAQLLEPKLAVEVGCETPTMELLETLDVPTEEWPYYLGFMKRMIVLYRNFTSETLASEKESLITEYVLRGKDRDVLEEVQEVAAACAEAIFEMDLWTRDFYKIIQFQSLDGFGWNTTITGTVSISGGMITLDTGGTSGSTATFGDSVSIPDPGLGNSVFSWNKNRKFRTGVRVTSDTNQVIYVAVGGYPPLLERFIGFKIVDNQIFGVVCDGVAETLTAALATITAGDEPMLETRFIAGESCTFYINGVEVGNLTSGLPSGIVSSENVLVIYITNTADEVKSSSLYLWEFYQKR